MLLTVLSQIHETFGLVIYSCGEGNIMVLWSMLKPCHVLLNIFIQQVSSFKADLTLIFHGRADFVSIQIHCPLPYYYSLLTMYD